MMDRGGRLSALIIASFLCIVVSSVALSFENSCNWSLKTNPNCTFTVSENWDFLQFRRWLDELRKPIKNVSLALKCIKNGSVFIPESMGARGLHSVSIRNCRIKGYISEYNQERKYPDSLREVFIADSIIEMDATEWLEKVELPPMEYTTCGQKKIQSKIKRNVSFRFFNYPKNFTVEMLLKSHGSHKDTIESLSWKCHYNDLEYLEVSGSSSVTFMKDLTRNAHYPKLSTLNLRSNNFHNIPKELQKWYEHFPALKYLDLSDNKISTFFFDIPTPSHWKMSLHVNLQNNNIKEEPKDFKWYPYRAMPIIVDLHDNPITENKTNTL